MAIEVHQEAGATLQGSPGNGGPMLYTPEERARRDSSVWTIVQGILAPVQFAIFLISLALAALAEHLAFGRCAAAAICGERECVGLHAGTAIA